MNFYFSLHYLFTIRNLCGCLSFGMRKKYKAFLIVSVIHRAKLMISYYYSWNIANNFISFSFAFIVWVWSFFTWKNWKQDEKKIQKSIKKRNFSFFYPFSHSFIHSFRLTFLQSVKRNFSTIGNCERTVDATLIKLHFSLDSNSPKSFFLFCSRIILVSVCPFASPPLFYNITFHICSRFISNCITFSSKFLITCIRIEFWK